MILLYHRVMSDRAPETRSCDGHILRAAVFRRHLCWLRRRFRIVPLQRYLESARPWAKRLAAITIDDAVWSTWRVVQPEIDELRLPVTVFLPTGHFENGRLYWFTYLDALCFEGRWPEIEWEGVRYPLVSQDDRRHARRALGSIARVSGSPADLAARLGERYALSHEVAEEYRAMTSDDVRGAVSSGLVEFGCHSVTHPYLDSLSTDLQQQEIVRSREMAEQAVGGPIRYFAYPGGAYTHETVQLVKRAGFSAAFACIPNREVTDRRFEWPRVGIYSASMGRLVVKSFGVAQVLRKLGVAIG